MRVPTCVQLCMRDEILTQFFGIARVLMTSIIDVRLVRFHPSALLY